MLSFPSDIRATVFPGVFGVIRLELGAEVPAYGEWSSYTLRPEAGYLSSKERNNDRMHGIDAVIMTR